MQDPVKILTIDDEQEIRNTIRDYLEDGGYEVYDAPEGESGLKAFSDVSPDLVLCDLRMPKINGLKVLERITEESPETPVIIISGTGDIREAAQTVKLGAWDYILKPIVDMSLLEKSIEDALTKSREIKVEKAAKALDSNSLAQKKAELEEVLSILNDKVMEVSNQKKVLILSEALSKTPEAVLLTNLKGKIEYVNESLLKMGGYSDENEILGKRINQYITNEEFSRLRSDIIPSMIANKHWQGIISILAKDGTEKPVEVTCTLISSDVNDNDSMVVANYHEISNKDSIDAVLKANESKYRTIFEISNDAIMLVKDEEIIDCNTRSLEIFACLRDEIVGTNIDSIFPELQPNGRNSKSMLKEIASNDYLEDKVFHEFTVFKCDGAYLKVKLNMTTVEDVDSPMDIIILRDISEITQLEEQLVRSQRLEALGRLTGGVAHDFNNLLAAISGNAQLSKIRLPKDDPTQQSMDEILKTADRAAMLTKQLLKFTKTNHQNFFSFSINKIIEDLHEMLTRLAADDIDLQLDLTENPGFIYADRSQIEQVIVNLCVNSRDAMPGGGTILIKTERVEVDESYEWKASEIKIGEYVKLIIEDSGTGIEESILEKIFNPFFTTKNENKGTGLGLSNVAEIVKRHNGDVKVSSEFGKGTRFEILLPASEVEFRQFEKKSRLEVNLHGSETVMIVENETSGSGVTSSYLSRFGYSVIKVYSADEALSHFKKGETIDFVISDIEIPGRTGIELRSDLMEYLPATRILLMSGQTINSLYQYGIINKNIPFLQKPFRPAALLSIMRRLIDKKPEISL